MATFLELCQDAARESSTIAGVAPTSVVGQEGRLAKFVYWVQQAWVKIQRSKRDWLWMQGEFSVTLIAGTARYSATGFSLTRWSRWVLSFDKVWLYDPDIGVSDEAALKPMDWNVYLAIYERGSQSELTDRPIHYAISPTGEICFGPKPDKAYPVRGPYRKNAQRLAANSDVPEMPEDFHEAIWQYALILMSEHDEGELHIAVNNRRYADVMQDLRFDQLPAVGIGAGPLA